MLIVMSGTSGAGKTEVSKHLTNRDRWQFITTYTTRPARANEKEKISVSQIDFCVKECSNFFYCVDEFYDNRYGLSLDDMTEAICDTTSFWLIDRPIWKLHTFRNIPHLSVVLLPQNRNQLVSQLIHSGRIARLDDVVLDFETNYAHLYDLASITTNTLVVTNAADCAADVAETILEWAKTRMEE